MAHCLLWRIGRQDACQYHQFLVSLQLCVASSPALRSLLPRLITTKTQTNQKQRPNQEKFKQWWNEKKRSSSTDVGLLKLVLQNVMLNTVEHKTGFYRSTWRRNDRSSFRRFTLPAGTIFRPPSALPEAVLWAGRISHCSRFLHLLLRFLFSFHFVSRWQNFFWLQVTL